MEGEELRVAKRGARGEGRIRAVRLGPPASFKNAAPSRRSARQHVLLPAPAGGQRSLLQDGVCTPTEAGQPAYFLQAARIAEARRGLRYLANITVVLGHRPTRMTALARPNQAPIRPPRPPAALVRRLRVRFPVWRPVPAQHLHEQDSMLRLA